jgi:hypothetical protein
MTSLAIMKVDSRGVHSVFQNEEHTDDHGRSPDNSYIQSDISTAILSKSLQL